MQLINKNFKFIIEYLLKLVEQKFKKSTKVPFIEIATLSSDLSNLNLGIDKPKPAPRSITKYSSEFI